MKESFASLIKKAIKFFFTSGIGFIMDFCLYTLLTQKFGFGVMRANFISSVLGCTFVFFVSTHKIFDTDKNGLPQGVKYAIYIFYQFCLIFAASKVSAIINDAIYNNINIIFLHNYSKLAAKVLITPFTMICNFFVIKYLAEKL